MVLISDRPAAGNLSKALTSFAFIPGSGGPQRFVTVNKEGSVEFCEVKESPQLAFAVSFSTNDSGRLAMLAP